MPSCSEHRRCLAWFQKQGTGGGELLHHALRSGDAVQLASCLYLQRELGQRVPLIAFDDRLNDAARAEGVSLKP